MHIAADLVDVRENLPLALLLSTLAGLSTTLGGLLAVLQSNISSQTLGLYQSAAAGFMLAVSLLDLLPTALSTLPLPKTAFYTTLGALLFHLLKALLPAPTFPKKSSGTDPASLPVLHSGLLTALSLALHNFPEGIAVCIASLRGLRLGLPLTIAIALHNIPEGVAVALPLFYATRDPFYAVRIAFLSGLAEPAGVLFVLIAINFSGALTPDFVAAATASVAGVMLALCVFELLPQAAMYAGVGRMAFGTAVGGVFMAVGLYFADVLVRAAV